jgi:hypothetical protein
MLILFSWFIIAFTDRLALYLFCQGPELMLSIAMAAAAAAIRQSSQKFPRSLIADLDDPRGKPMSADTPPSCRMYLVV